MEDNGSIVNEINEYTYKEYRDQCGIPPEYWTYKLNEYDAYDENGVLNPTKQAAHKAIILYINHLEENFEKGAGLYIQGQVNRKHGISLLGTFVLRAALQRLKKCLYREFSTFVLDISTFNEEVYAPYYSVDYLMLDSIDVFRSMSTSKIHDQFADIVSYRRTHQKPIIFCSYQSYHEMASVYCQSLLGYVPIHTHIINLSSERKKEDKFTIHQVQMKLRDYIEKNKVKKNVLEKKYTPEEIVKMVFGG